MSRMRVSWAWGSALDRGRRCAHCSQRTDRLRGRGRGRLRRRIGGLAGGWGFGGGRQYFGGVVVWGGRGSAGGGRRGRGLGGLDSLFRRCRILRGPLRCTHLTNRPASNTVGIGMGGDMYIPISAQRLLKHPEGNPCLFLYALETFRGCLGGEERCDARIEGCTHRMKGWLLWAIGGACRRCSSARFRSSSSRRHHLRRTRKPAGKCSFGHDYLSYVFL